MTKDLIDGKTNWLTKIKSLLQENGFLYVWEHPNAINQDQFIVSFKQRLIDSYIQTWFTNISSSTVLSTFYNFLKEDFTIESYLKICLPRDLRIQLSKIRTSSHNLLIESGRHGRIRLPRNERICRHCDLNSIEDEFHFIIECPFFSGLRKKFIKRYYLVRPSMYKFLCLMKRNDYDVLFDLCKYIKLAFLLK